MKMVYIAGPYGDRGGYLAIDRNIARAREAAALLVNNGIGFSCPHMNSAHFEVITPGVPVSFWRELDLKLLQGCDGIVVLDGWQRSEGTQGEILEAQRLGLEIFYLPDLDMSEDWGLLLEWAEEVK